MLLVDDILFFPVTSILWIFREISKIAHEELDWRSPVDQRATETPLHATGNRPDYRSNSSMPKRSSCWTGWTPSTVVWKTRKNLRNPASSTAEEETGNP